MKPLLANDRTENGVESEQAPVSASHEQMASEAIDGTLLRDGDVSALFQQQLQITRSRLTSAKDLQSIQQIVALHVKSVCKPVLLAWYYPSGKQIGQSDRLEGLLSPTDGLADALRDLMKQAAIDSNRRGEICSCAVTEKLRLFAQPIPSFPGHCLLTVTEPRHSSAEIQNHITSSLLILSSLINEWSLLQAGAQSADNARTVAAMIELVAHVHSADDAPGACQRLVDSLQRHLAAERVIVGLCRRGLSDVKVTAISGGGVVDPFSVETRLVESVLQESLIRSASGIWPVLDPTNRHALLSHQQLAESGFGETLISMPIRTESGASVGSLLVVLNRSNSGKLHVDQIRETERFLRAGAGALAGCLSVLQKLADSRWLKVIRSARHALTTSRLQLVGWITAAVAMLLLVPMTYRIRCSLELQPVERHYVAAPFDGPLEECLVEPGDVVVKDQLLAQMHGREIRWELAEVQANLNKATKERNTQLSKKEFGNAAISGHEMQRLEQRAALLTHRSSSLEIRSPADGVVVSGDHREAEGVPLEMGKTLFEIAPLNAMVVELCVPEADVRHVEIGMSVAIQLEAVPEESITAVIRTVHPRAELRDGENIFVAEADILNEDALLRPGMKGSATISTRRHTLGWNLFHKPTAWLLGWLGW